MDLFESLTATPRNLLPHDGCVRYWGPVMSKVDADQYFDALLGNIDWKNDEAVIFGKKITTRRKVAWYSDKPHRYEYSNVTKTALPWTEELRALKAIVEHATSARFNSCLLNLYHDGSEGMAWHSDAEKDLQKHGAIGSLSFGAERKFAFKHKKTKETVSHVLQHGSVLLMEGVTQTWWLHRLPPTRSVHTPRINLTFRTIVGEP